MLPAPPAASDELTPALRCALHQEVHARPPQELHPPLAVTHWAFVIHATERAASRGVLAGDAADVPARLLRYAEARWHRCARVQARSERNSVIFHARRPMRVGRNPSLRLMGGRLMDVPGLYGGTD